MPNTDDECVILKTKEKGMNTLEERVISSSGKKATVEVTVKVKKHRHYSEDGRGKPSRKCVDVKEPYPRGSWGDLLSRNAGNELREIVSATKAKAKSDIVKEHMNCYGEGKLPKSICHKIPINSQLYLETHTHVKPRSKSSGHRSEREKDYKKDARVEEKLREENAILRTEAAKLMYQVQQAKSGASNIAPRNSKNFMSETTANEKMKLQEENATLRNQITTLLSQIEEKKTILTTDIVDKPEREKSMQDLSLDKQRYQELIKENEALRRHAGSLIHEMKKAKEEQQESIMTIKELYQLAELLKRENQKLVGVQEEQQVLHQQLLQAVNENKELKDFLEAVQKKQDNSHVKKSEGFLKIKNVIHEVKSTIEKEMKGFNINAPEKEDHNREHEEREGLRGPNFLNTSQGNSALFNDTDASEIQRILGSGAGRWQNLDEEINLDRPHSSHNLRISTPRQHSQSLRSSSPNEEMSLSKIVESLENDVSRSFLPIQLQLSSSRSSTPIQESYGG